MDFISSAWKKRYAEMKKRSNKCGFACTEIISLYPLATYGIEFMMCHIMGGVEHYVVYVNVGKTTKIIFIMGWKCGEFIKYQFSNGGSI